MCCSTLRSGQHVLWFQCCACVRAGLIEHVLPLSGCVFSPLAVMKRRGESICFEVCSWSSAAERDWVDEGGDGGLRLWHLSLSGVWWFPAEKFSIWDNESHWSSVCSRLTDLIWSVFLPATPADPSVTSLWQSATVNYHADMILTESHSNFKWLTCQSHLPTHEHTSTHWWFAPGANGNKKKSPTTQKVFFSINHHLKRDVCKTSNLRCILWIFTPWRFNLKKYVFSRKDVFMWLM